MKYTIKWPSGEQTTLRRFKHHTQHKEPGDTFDHQTNMSMGVWYGQVLDYLERKGAALYEGARRIGYVESAAAQ